jgi:UDP-GlcNAc:undecaprenyl-phosphate/decaprenyl-phosphate GlcNAc-1-phosphate transferase
VAYWDDRACTDAFPLLGVTGRADSSQALPFAVRVDRVSGYAMSLVLAFLTAFALTVILVPLVAQFARARNMYAQPSYDRWHRRPVPKIGGLAMLPPLLIVCTVGGFVPKLYPVLVGATLMFGVGLVDDFRTFRPATKLVLQMLAAAVLLFLLPNARITGVPIVDLLLGFAWIIGITNAVNLLDNMDGLAAGVACIAGTCFLGVLMLDGAPGIAPLAMSMAAFVGVTAGFLLFNFHPASIFMGDGGSHLLGCFLAGSALMATPSMGSHLAPVAAIPVVLLLIPIFDTSFVTLARGLAGRSAFLGGRDHTSHRLVALGIGERRAVLVLYVLTALGGAVALGLLGFPPGLAWGFVGLYGALLALLGIYLGHVQVNRGIPSAEAPLPTEVTTRHRLYEVLLDTLLISGAYYLAFVGRFRDEQFAQFVPYFTRSVPIVVGIQVATLWLSGKYRQVWGRLGPFEMFSLFRSSMLGVAGSVIAVLYIDRFIGYSRWVFAFDAILAPMFIVSARVGLSAVDEYLRLRRSRGRLALVYGAGKGGALTVREILQNPSLGLTPIGFLDDDARKRRLRVDGLGVVGTLDDLPALLDRRPGHVSVVVVSIGALARDRLDRVCDICAPRGVAVRRMRVDLEDIRRQTQPSSVVRFPGA